MLDENWTSSDTYPAPLYFHCPNTMCDGHVKLKDRSRRHAVTCDKCGLEFAIGSDTIVTRAADASLRYFDHAVVLLLGIVGGIILGKVLAL